MKLLLPFILAAALFLRTYKLDQLLGFYYDQGRDALVVWQFIHEGKFFLVGPVTGIEGIFLGPFYYYLLIPLYFLGRGSPVFVAAILNLISVAGIALLYLIAKEFFDRKTAILTTFLVSFSYSLVIFSRWLSHPPLLSTFSLVIIYALLKIYRGKEKWWLIVGLFLGICLQLEAAAATFFIPTILVFAFWQRKKIKNFSLIIVSLFLFLLTLAPQIIFNFRHQGILFASFQKFLVGEKSFSPPFLELARERLMVYFGILFSKFFYAKQNLSLIWLPILIGLGFLKRKEIFAGERKILVFWLFLPLIFYLFYQGNQGFFLDYYFSGIWLIFMILISFLLVSIWPKIWGKFLVLIFLISFIYVNFSQLLIYSRIGIGVLFRDQIAALNWIYQDAQKQEFNVDIYVPPVIPHAYDYLFKWHGQKEFGRQPVAKQVTLLYTLSEADAPHPERLKAWFERQQTLSKIIAEESFGEIKVQKRERIKFSE